MKSMLFAAGLGTRLRPLTNDRPKALVEVSGVPLLEIAIRRLIDAGCEDIIVNVHHFADLVIEFLRSKKNFGINITISDEREMILETGGGLKKTEWFFENQPAFLVCNVDVLTNLDLKIFYEKHLASGALATLAVRHRETSRYLLFDEKMKLFGWENVRTGEMRLAGSLQSAVGSQQLAFSGIHAISPRIFEHMPSGERKFSIIETYLQAMETETILGYLHDDDAWLDVGKPEALKRAKDLFPEIGL